MNRKTMTSALIGMAVTVCTTLTTLFSQAGIVNFSDVHPVSYMTAILGGLVTFFHTWQARMAPTPSTNTQGVGSTMKVIWFLAVGIFGACLYAPPDVYAAGTSAAATVDVSWTAPTTREDGTALKPTEISAYRVYYKFGGAPSTSDRFVKVDSGATQSISVPITPGPDPQTLYVAVTAVDINGLESAMSNVASKTFVAASTSPPGPPTNVTFAVSCNSGCTITPQ